MAAPPPIDERLDLLEARMTALEQLPGRMDRVESQIAELREEMRAGHVLIVTELTAQIEESRRHSRLLHEDALGRIGVVGEGLMALDGKFDEAQGEIRAMFERILTRLDAPRTP